MSFMIQQLGVAWLFISLQPLLASPASVPSRREIKQR